MRKHIKSLHQHTKRNYHITGTIITIITLFFINQFIELNSIGIILNQFQSLFINNLIIGIILYISLTTIILNSPLAITPILYILSGFLYGPVYGAILSVISFTIASTIGFGIVRKFFRKKFQNKYSSKINKINKEIQDHGLHYFFSLRTIVIIPHYLITILAGLSKIKKKTFIIASGLGFIPEAIVYTFAGSTLTNLINISEIISPHVIIALSLIVIIGIIPAIRKIIRKREINKLEIIKFSDKPIFE